MKLIISSIIIFFSLCFTNSIKTKCKFLGYRDRVSFDYSKPIRTYGYKHRCCRITYEEIRSIEADFYVVTKDKYFTIREDSKGYCDNWIEEKIYYFNLSKMQISYYTP